MSRMMMLPALSSLCLVSSLFALDEYMPVPFRVMQIDVGFERTSITGNYNQSYESDDQANTNNPSSIPVQGKFGVLDNLEGSMAIDYVAQDSLGHAGLNRPVLALKYADPIKGAGGYLAVALPVGFDEIMNAGNYATMTFGALYGRKFPFVNLLANASYSFNTEDDQKSKMDNLRLFVKPEYSIPAAWLTQHKQYLGVYLGLVYNFYFNAMVEGESLDNNAMLFQVAPGVNYVFNKLVSLEVNAPISLIGQSQPASDVFRAQLHFSLEEGLYNSL
jgi:hypothetical protein